MFTQGKPSCKVSIRRIAADLGVDVGTARRWINELVKNGCISRKRTSDGGNIYTCLKEPEGFEFLKSDK